MGQAVSSIEPIEEVLVLIVRSLGQGRFETKAQESKKLEPIGMSFNEFKSIGQYWKLNRDRFSELARKIRTRPTVRSNRYFKAEQPELAIQSPDRRHEDEAIGYLIYKNQEKLGVHIIEE